MSNPDEPENPIEAFHKSVESDPRADSQAAGRSAADDIIETIGDFSRPQTKRSRHACPSCGSTEFKTTKPLGGAPRHVCRSCRNIWYGSPRSPAKLVLAKNGPTQTSVAGPYYNGTASRPKQDKHSPKSRLKAKSHSALKEKLK